VVCSRRLFATLVARYPAIGMVKYISEGAGPGLVVSCIVPLVVAWSFFCMRIYVRWIMLKMWKVEDWLFVASQVSLFRARFSFENRLIRPDHIYSSCPFGITVSTARKRPTSSKHRTHRYPNCHAGSYFPFTSRYPLHSLHFTPYTIHSPPTPLTRAVLLRR
jgi:hypothetical protein